MKILVRYSLLTIGLYLVLSSAISAQSTSPDKKTAAVIDRQRAYFAAIKKKDGAALSAMLTDDYVGVYADGIFDKALELKALADFKLNDYGISEEKVAFPNSKTATINFKLRVQVFSTAGTFYETDNILCVWTLDKKTWRLTSQAAVKTKTPNK